MVLVHPIKLLIDDSKHTVNLDIKKSLELLPCSISASHSQTVTIKQATHLVRIILDSSMFAFGKLCPGSIPGTSIGIVGSIDDAAVP